MAEPFVAFLKNTTLRPSLAVAVSFAVPAATNRNPASDCAVHALAPAINAACAAAGVTSAFAGLM